MKKRIEDRDERRAELERRRAVKRCMWRVKVKIKLKTGVYGNSVTKKFYFRDKDAALKEQNHYREMLDSVLRGSAIVFTLGEDSSYRADCIIGGKVTLREPEKSPELPETLTDDEEDD